MNTHRPDRPPGPSSRRSLRLVRLALALSVALLPGRVSTGAIGSEDPIDGDSPPRLDAAPILTDVSAISGGGNPASMLCWGSAAPLVVAPDGTVLAAATRLGAGRIVALGHGSFLGSEGHDTPRFIANALTWLASTPVDRPLRLPAVAGPARALLAESGRAVELVDAKLPALDAVDVVVGSPQQWARAGRLDELAAWIAGGGAMLATETAWGVLQLNDDLTLDTLAVNRLLEPAGLRFTRDAHSPFGEDGDYPVVRERLAVGNAETALTILSAGRDAEREGDRTLAGQVVGRALTGVPLEGALIARARTLAAEHAEAYGAAARGLAEKRVTAKRDPLFLALLDLDARLANELPPAELRAHPSSVAFPGPVGEARLGSTEVSFDPRVPGWFSTGLYVPPGEVVRVTVPESALTAGWTLQVGAWRDPHRHDHRRRLRTALRRFPVTGTVTEVASAIGGPLYLDLPVEFARGAGAEPLSITVEGAAPMPVYRRGVTDVEEWRTTIRHHEAPVAEFISDELVLTVPASAVRSVEHPDRVMEHWDAVHAAMESLEPRTPNHWADRPYRYVADVSVSWGYMYCPSNGPIVIPWKSAAAMFDLENYDGAGENRLWGHYHEMGHAHQNPRWTDRTTGEVTVNIFTVYALHTVNGFPLDSPAMRTEPRKAWETFAKHRETGAPFERVGGAFPRLQFYALLWHAFGFDAFHTTFDAIRAMENGGRNDIGFERNRFLVAFGNAVERDLSDYGAAWGMQVTDATREALARYPTWMPEAPEGADPPKKGSAL